MIDEMSYQRWDLPTWRRLFY